MASGRTLSARRLHRHQHVETRRECRRLLQQARDVRAMDQGGKRRNQVDTAVMSVIRRQRGSSTASCAGLQSRQFSAHAGDAGADQGGVADEAEGKADQDRREDRQPWPLRRVSDGRSRHSQKSLCRHSADDRGTAAARCIDSVMRSVSRIPSKTGGKVPTENSANSAFGSTSERPYTLRKRVRGDPGLPITTNRRRVVFNRHLSGECRLSYAGINEKELPPVAWLDGCQPPRAEPFDDLPINFQQNPPSWVIHFLLEQARNGKPFSIKFHLQIKAKVLATGD